MYTYIIVDDDLFSSKLLEKSLELLHKDLIHDNTFSDSQAALDYLKECDVDIVFLDIQMPDINGLELRNKVKENIEIIFTTASSKYALQAFDGNVTDYLVKPINEKHLTRAIKKAKKNVELRRQLEIKSSPILQTELQIKHNNKTHKICIDEILYIESKKECLAYHINNGETLIKYGSLYKIEAELPKDFFIRIHRSFIVNKSYLKHYNKKEIKLKNNELLPIGKKYSNTVVDYLSISIR